VAVTGVKAAGSLVVVGTGIQAFTHLTAEARLYLQRSDRVLYLVADPLTELMIRELNPRAESLHGLYARGKRRLKTYREMTDRILDAVRAGHSVCAAFYGHPGVFATTPHVSIRMARKEGYSAQLLPAVSAEACLFADLGLDPAIHGWQSFEATDFLLQRRRPDRTAGLVLLQIGVIGETDFRAKGANRRNLAVLSSMLGKMYGPAHRVVVYEASTLAGIRPRICELPLRRLAKGPVTPTSTLYVPPVRTRPFDRKMFARLGLTPENTIACVR
jgi:Tetrapyrrole (Corrin/Porphyrin) Methylases